MNRSASGIYAAAALLLIVSGCAGTRQQSTSPVALFSLRLAHETQAPGTQRMETAESGEAYFVAEEVVISDEHIETARVVETATGLNVFLRLTDEGVSRLRDSTRSHLGQRLAILVGSRLMKAPVIAAEIRSSDATLGLTLSPDEARSVRAAIATRFQSLE